MWPSSKIQLSVLGFFLSMTLVACSLGKPQERPGSPEDGAGLNQGAATFILDKVAAPSVISTTTHKNISLPISKTYSFQVCVKEMQHQNPILNHRFEISGGEKSFEVTSDANGCLIWSEDIVYNHLAKAYQIKVTRRVLAQGIQKGQRQITYALNPWEDQGEALINKPIADLVEVSALTAANAETSPGIWIDDMRLTVEEKGVTAAGQTLRIESRSQPTFAVTKSGGRRVLEPITRGKFKAEMFLVNVSVENQKEVRRPITQKVSTEGSIANNALVLTLDLTLPAASRMGQVQLALKVIPLEAPENVGPFEGVFIMGEFDQIKGNSMSRLKNSFQDAQGKLKLSEYLTESMPPAAVKGSNEADFSQNGSQPGYQKSQVQIAPLQTVTIGYKNPNSNLREKVFTVTACMSTPIDNKALRAQIFEVKKVNGTTESLRSNESGCITWEDSIQFQYLDSECWMNRPVQISNSNYAMNQSLNLQINPWTEGPAGIRDSRQVGQQELLCAQGKSKIVLFHYDFDKKTVKYPIDSFLNIKVQKEGILKLQGRLKRPSLVDPSGYEDAALPPGKYFLRWAVVDHAVHDFSKAANQIYQVGEKWVQIDVSGTLAETITLESANLRALGNTNFILFELKPEGDTSNLETTTFSGPLVMSNMMEAGTLEVLQDSSESLIAKLGEQLKKDLQAQKNLQQKLSKKEAFAFNEKLGFLNLNDNAQMLKFQKALGAPKAWMPNASAAFRNQPPLPLQDLSQWVKTGNFTPELANKFCAFWFLDQLRRPLAQRGGQSVLPLQGEVTSHLQYLCTKAVASNPASYFDVEYRYFLKDAVKIKDLTSEVRDVAFNHSFSLSQSHDVSETKTFSYDVGVGISTAKYFAPVSVGGGFRYQISKAEGDRTGTANSSSVQSGESVLLEKLNFQIQASGFEKCAVIRLNPEIFAPERSPILKYTNKNLKPEVLAAELGYGIMICEGAVQNKNIVFTESYFILNQKSSNTQAIDAYSDYGRPLFMAVRGSNDFRRLLQSLNGQIKAPGSAYVPTQNTQMMQSTLGQTFARGYSTYPGQFAAGK